MSHINGEKETLADNPIMDIDATFDNILKDIKGPQKRAAVKKIKNLPDAERLKWLMDDDNNEEQEGIQVRSTGAVVCVFFIYVVVVVSYIITIWKTKIDKDGKPVTDDNGDPIKEPVQETRQRKEKRKKRIECEPGSDGTCEAPEE